MPRFADIDKVMQNLNVDKYGDTNVVEVGIALDKARVDVVPKSEVEKLEIEIEALKIANEKMYEAFKRQAREIFEEIDKIIEASAYKAVDDYDGATTTCHSVVLIMCGLNELKKKYKEGIDKNENET